MSVDSDLGKICYFEDFVGWDIIADQPEVAVDTDPAVEIVAAGIGGVVRITMDAGQTNIGGIIVGQTQWSVYDNFLEFSARVKLSAVGAAAERVFVGLTDLQEDTVSEMPFTGATTVLTASGDPDDCIGFFYEGDMTGQYWQPGSIDGDAVVVGSATNAMDAIQRANAALVAGQWHTLKFRVENAGFHATFYVDGREVYRYVSTTAPVTSDVPFVPVFVATEGTTAIDADLDYIKVEMGRDN